MMECISSDQLRSYEHIITKINSEFQRTQQLQKKLEEEDNNIIICKLSNTRINRKLCHVDVKIFTDLTNLLLLYEGEIRNVDRLVNHSGCKYYLIEIYITKVLLKKLSGTKWLINICLYNDNIYLSRALRLSSKIPILEVLVVEEDVIDCTLEAYLTLSSSDKSMIISLDKKIVDVSYHFRIYKKNHNLLDSKKVESLLMQESRLPCNIDMQYFKQQFINNCYHNLGVELLTNSESKNDFSMSFVCNIGKSTVYVSSKEICVKSNVYELQRLKTFFCKVIEEYKKCNKHVST